MIYFPFFSFVVSFLPFSFDDVLPPYALTIAIELSLNLRLWEGLGVKLCYTIKKKTSEGFIEFHQNSASFKSSHGKLFNAICCVSHDVIYVLSLSFCLLSTMVSSQEGIIGLERQTARLKTVNGIFFLNFSISSSSRREAFNLKISKMLFLIHSLFNSKWIYTNFFILFLNIIFSF